MKTILDTFSKHTNLSIWLMSVLALFVLFLARFVVQDYADLTPFLIVPVLLASWYGNSKAGIGLSVLIVCVSLLISPKDDFIIFSNLTNIVINFIVYVFLSIIVTNFREVHKFESNAADTDTLTGVYSSRYFYTVMENEILRSSRYGHKLSLSYIDIDDFKNINDTLGHSVGDELLIDVSQCLVSSLRATDIVARIGGDEFVCLLPETKHDEAKAAFLKAEENLNAKMKNKNWNVSFSIGIVTFETLPNNVHEAINIADKLMYSVKNNNKNGIAYKVYKVYKE